MRVRFWGTRGSIATPGPGTHHFGGNTSCVELTTDAGETLIFDCGTGARLLGAALQSKATGPVRASIFFSHTHWDHIQGFPFFAPAFVPGNEIDIYGAEGGSRSLQGILSGQMEFTYFPVELNQLPASLAYHDLQEGTYEVGGAQITTQYLNHPAVTFGYRVECDGATVLYLTDHEPFAEALWRSDAEPGRIEAILHEGDRRHARFMADADLVIHDAQYTPEEYPAKKNWGHSSYEYVVEVAAAAGVRRLALTHHDPSHDDAFLADVERRARRLAKSRGSALEVFCAYEGYERSVKPSGSKETTGTGEHRAATDGHQGELHILVVDDDENMRKLTRDALKRERYSVLEAQGGEDALRQVEKVLPSMIVLDFRMPDLDGLEVLRRLRSRPETADLPVLIVTGMSDERSITTMFEAGATDYLTKPFTLPQLTSRVRACLARAAGKRAPEGIKGGEGKFRPAS